MERGLLKTDDLIAYIGGTLSNEVGTTSLEFNRVSDLLDFYSEEEQKK